jgi:hypothetical protein
LGLVVLRIVCGLIHFRFIIAHVGGFWETPHSYSATFP